MPLKPHRDTPIPESFWQPQAAEEISGIAAAGRELARHAQAGGVTELSRAEAELRRGERPKRPPTDKARIMRGKALGDNVRGEMRQLLDEGHSTKDAARLLAEAAVGREEPLTPRKWAVSGYGPGMAGGVCEPMRVWWPERRREEENSV